MICIGFILINPKTGKFNTHYKCNTLPDGLVPFCDNWDMIKRPPPTLLNHVCRYLYHSTRLLPFKLNTWAFKDYGNMWDFIWVRKVISKQQCGSIKILIVSRELPGSNLLGYMGNVQGVVLSKPGKVRCEPGYPRWFRVVEGEKGLECERMVVHLNL